MWFGEMSAGDFAMKPEVEDVESDEKNAENALEEDYSMKSKDTKNKEITTLHKQIECLQYQNKVNVH